MNEPERRALILQLRTGTPDAEQRAVTLATITAGMTPFEIGKLIEPGKALPVGDPSQEVLKFIHACKREMIEKECAGRIEFIEPKHGLAAVGCHEHIKHELMAIAKNLKEGETTLTPMGLLAVGPRGSGKTCTASTEELLTLCETLSGYSNADLEAFLVRSIPTVTITW